jgi:hypothetical protein
VAAVSVLGGLLTVLSLSEAHPLHRLVLVVGSEPALDPLEHRANGRIGNTDRGGRDAHCRGNPRFSG